MILVPSSFYNEDCAREYIAQVVDISKDAEVNSVFMPQYDAYFIYSGDRKPELYRVLDRLGTLPEYNKILCHWDGETLSLGIGQGKSLLLSNTYRAGDFVSVMYFVLLALKSLQLNPEMSTICFMSELSSDDKILLYHYFKSVSVL